jgi:hypothetical protein
MNTTTLPSLFNSFEKYLAPFEPTTKDAVKFVIRLCLRVGGGQPHDPM